MEKNFKSFREISLDTIKKRRARNITNICRYGLGILDDYLGGIVENELVVIGAGPGVGKTDLAVNIALTNAMLGKRVKLLSLEGDVGEITYRYFQRNINKKKMSNKQKIIKGPEYRLNLSDVNELEQKVFEEIPKELDNLQIFDKSYIPDKTKLLELMKNNYKDTDLFVIDHLHYLDFGQNEYTGISEIVKGVKEMTEIMEVPVVLISHLSRKNGDKDRLPSISDLHGSSNIEKNANTIILLTPAKSNEFIAQLNETAYLRGTTIIVGKNRTGMPVPAIFDTVYDLRTKEYVVGDLYNGLAVNDNQRITVNDRLFG